MLPTNASVPPKIGEYSYYDSRMSHNNNILSKEYASHWIINTEEETLRVACHYSLPVPVDNQDFITGHGIITEIHTKIPSIYEKDTPCWVNSLGKNIMESVVLEIGDSVNDGYNYINELFIKKSYRYSKKKIWD